jgi:hypothetical protein
MIVLKSRCAGVGSKDIDMYDNESLTSAPTIGDMADGDTYPGNWGRGLGVGLGRKEDVIIVWM